MNIENQTQIVPPILTLLIGEYKTGKTVSSCTFPKPLIFLDWDMGFTSVSNTYTPKGQKVIENQEGITRIEFVKEGYFDLDFKTSLTGSTAPVHTQAVPAMLQKFNEVMKSLAKDGCYDGKGPFKTLVIDSLTAMFLVWKDMILNMNRVPHLRVQDYDTLESLLFRQLMPSLKAINKMIPYTILINHIDMDKDELSGKIMEFPVGPSKNMGKKLGRAFDEIWIQKIESGERVWRTTKDGLLNAGSRLNLPEIIKPATFDTLEGVMKKRGV